MLIRNRFNIPLKKCRRFTWTDISKARTFVAIAAALVLYVLFLDTFLASLYWPTENCINSSTCIHLLVVADPQIGGEQDEPWLFIWDSDRYLQRWYAQAFSFVKPDAVLFLGDLMDEGSRAADDEFQRYSDRFYSIFPKEQHVKYFYLPGDNDIGGEYGEPIIPDIVQRFFCTFNDTPQMTLESVHVIKVNVPLEVQQSYHIPHDDNSIVILASHFPLISLGAFGRTPYSLKRFRPNLIISAHSHISELRQFAQYGAIPLNQYNFTIQSEWKLEQLMEISVPTCSYRMGVHQMGYGRILIDTTRREVYYAVLWLPNRFIQLKILGLSGFVLLIYVCFSFACIGAV